MTTFQYCLAITVVALTSMWTWRAAREGVYCDAEGVTIRWVIGKKDVLSWKDVVAIEDGMSQTDCLLGFRLSTGKVVRSSVQWSGGVFQSTISPILFSRSYESLVRRLRELHQHAISTTRRKFATRSAHQGRLKVVKCHS